jgi:hypothetical protein
MCIGKSTPTTVLCSSKTASQHCASAYILEDVNTRTICERDTLTVFHLGQTLIGCRSVTRVRFEPINGNPASAPQTVTKSCLPRAKLRLAANLKLLQPGSHPPEHYCHLRELPYILAVINVIKLESQAYAFTRAISRRAWLNSLSKATARSHLMNRLTEVES